MTTGTTVVRIDTQSRAGSVTAIEAGGARGVAVSAVVRVGFEIDTAPGALCKRTDASASNTR